MRSLLTIVVFLAAILVHAADMRAQEFRTSYGSALFITPANVAVEFAPNLDFQPVISISAEYSFPKTERIGFAFGGGFYSYSQSAEIVGRFGIRRFNTGSAAPVGPYWEMQVIGGATEARVTGAVPEPLFGLGVMIGNVRASRFGAFGFTYAGGPSVILTGGQTQVRMNFYFGIGYLFGGEVLIEH